MDFLVLFAAFLVVAYLAYGTLLSQSQKHAVAGLPQSGKKTTPPRLQPTESELWNASLADFAMTASKANHDKKAEIDEFVGLARQCVTALTLGKKVNLNPAKISDLWTGKPTDAAKVDSILHEPDGRVSIAANFPHSAQFRLNATTERGTRSCWVSYGNKETPIDEIKIMHASAVPVIGELVEKDWTVFANDRMHGASTNLLITKQIQQNPPCSLEIQNMIDDSTNQVTFSAKSNGQGCDAIPRDGRE